MPKKLKSRVKKSKKSLRKSRKPRKSEKKSSVKTIKRSRKSYKMKRKNSEIELYPNLIAPVSNEKEIMENEERERKQRREREYIRIPKILTQEQKEEADQYINHDYTDEEALELWVASNDDYNQGRKHYQVINDALKKGEEDNLKGSYKAVYHKIIDLFRKTTPITEEMIVYRGMRGTQPILEKLGNEPYKRLMSTSRYIEIAYRFMREECCILEIVLLPGIKVIDIDMELGIDMGTEKEILVEKGGRFRYLGYYDDETLDRYNYEPIRIYKLSYGPW